MSLNQSGGRPVHYPADPNKFVFDAEVSAIFPDMARRSIPNFYEAHAAHAEMLSAWIKPGVEILDVGASRGAFLKALVETHGVFWEIGDINYTALDNSPEMCAHLQTDYPRASVRCVDIASNAFLDHPQQQYDVVCAHYVLQFLPPIMQIRALRKLLQMVKPGGVFILGHKSQSPGFSGEIAHEQYIKFRMSYGYTREEIQAKTMALKGSMFPMNHYEVVDIIRATCSEVTETFRFMMFSTLFAVK